MKTRRSNVGRGSSLQKTTSFSTCDRKCLGCRVNGTGFRSRNKLTKESGSDSDNAKENLIDRNMPRKLASKAGTRERQKRGGNPVKAAGKSAGVNDESGASLESQQDQIQSSVTGEVDEGREGRNIMKIDTKNYCLFCLKHCSRSFVGDDEFADPAKNVEIGSKYMTFISRYLNLKRFRRSVRDGSLRSLAGRKTGQPRFEIVTCNTCLIVLKASCDLYQQHQQILLQLDWNVEKLRNVMRQAEKVPARATEFRANVLEGGNAMREEEKQLLDLFKRDFFRTTCKKDPKVVLNRVDGEPPTNDKASRIVIRASNPLVLDCPILRRHHAVEVLSANKELCLSLFSSVNAKAAPSRSEKGKKRDINVQETSDPSVSSPQPCSSSASSSDKSKPKSCKSSQPSINPIISEPKGKTKLGSSAARGVPLKPGVHNPLKIRNSKVVKRLELKASNARKNKTQIVNCTLRPQVRNSENKPTEVIDLCDGNEDNAETDSGNLQQNPPKKAKLIPSIIISTAPGIRSLQSNDRDEVDCGGKETESPHNFRISSSSSAALHSEAQNATEVPSLLENVLNMEPSCSYAIPLSHDNLQPGDSHSSSSVHDSQESNYDMEQNHVDEVFHDASNVEFAYNNTGQNDAASESISPPPGPSGFQDSPTLETNFSEGFQSFRPRNGYPENGSNFQQQAAVNENENHGPDYGTTPIYSTPTAYRAVYRVTQTVTSTFTTDGPMSIPENFGVANVFPFPNFLPQFPQSPPEFADPPQFEPNLEGHSTENMNGNAYAGSFHRSGARGSTGGDNMNPIITEMGSDTMDSSSMDGDSIASHDNNGRDVEILEVNDDSNDVQVLDDITLSA